MSKKYLNLLLILLFLAFAGCVKESYNMDKLSDNIRYSPTFSLAAVTGNITLSDIIKSGDTIRFDSDKFMRIVFKKDSVFDLKLKDYYDLNDMISYSNGYTIGDIKIDNFQSTFSLTLNTISQSFTPSLRSTFLALDNGVPHNFPSFPVTTIPEQSFTAITNFVNAVFSSGTLEIAVKNNLTAPLNDIKIRLYNSAGHLLIGNELTILAINPGATQTAIMNLAGKTITNSIVAAITFNGSPGTSTPVIVKMSQTVDVTITGSDLKVQSGRIKAPAQTISSADNFDTITIKPAENIEIEKLRVTAGKLTYHLISKCKLSATLSVTLPTSLKAGAPVTEIMNVNPNADFKSNIDVSNTELDLSKDMKKPFNRVPVLYSATVTSGGALVDFNKNDSIHFEMELLNPDLDYVRGYFGQLTKQIDADTLKTDIDDILNHITGQFHISDPSVRVNYSNSFGIPVEITLNATGVKNLQKVNLGLAPFAVSYPTTLTQRVVNSTFTVSKANSALPDLISLPPSEIRFSGSGKMNPQGFSGTRDNLVFGNSRFTASLEIEVPMQLWINNLQFTDTLNNFLKPDNSDDSPFNPENMELFNLNITVDNGFPLGASLRLMLYDSATKSIIKTIDATDVIKPAAVDANGKSSGKTESLTTIQCDKAFFESSKKSDKMIVMFTMNTTGGGTKDVKIYSDYTLSFKIAFKIKPVIKP